MSKDTIILLVAMATGSVPFGSMLAVVIFMVRRTFKETENLEARQEKRFDSMEAKIDENHKAHEEIKAEQQEMKLSFLTKEDCEEIRALGCQYSEEVHQRVGNLEQRVGLVEQRIGE